MGTKITSTNYATYCSDHASQFHKYQTEETRRLKDNHRVCRILKVTYPFILLRTWDNFLTMSSTQSSYHSSKASIGLPDDEFRTLQKRQNRSRLEKHFAHQGSSNHYSRPRTAYQKADLSQEERLRISKVKNATRQALGSSFDFTDSGCSYSQQSDVGLTLSATETLRDSSSYEEPIPREYIDAFNQRWYEDDDVYEPAQYVADHTFNAPWRQHADMYTDIEPITCPEVAPFGNRHSRVGSAIDDRFEQRPLTSPRPQLVSKFSFDSDMPSRKRRFFRLRR